MDTPLYVPLCTDVGIVDHTHKDNPLECTDTVVIGSWVDLVPPLDHTYQYTNCGRGYSCGANMVIGWGQPAVPILAPGGLVQ